MNLKNLLLTIVETQHTVFIMHIKKKKKKNNKERKENEYDEMI